MEAILVLEKNKKKVKSVEIARMLSVSQPGVNKAMNILKKGGLIEKDDYSGITLTEKGRAEAEKSLSTPPADQQVFTHVGRERRGGREGLL